MGCEEEVDSKSSEFDLAKYDGVWMDNEKSKNGTSKEKGHMELQLHVKSKNEGTVKILNYSKGNSHIAVVNSNVVFKKNKAVFNFDDDGWNGKGMVKVELADKKVNLQVNNTEEDPEMKWGLQTGKYSLTIHKAFKEVRKKKEFLVPPLTLNQHNKVLLENKEGSMVLAGEGTDAESSGFTPNHYLVVNYRGAFKDMWDQSPLLARLIFDDGQYITFADEIIGYQELSKSEVQVIYRTSSIENTERRAARLDFTFGSPYTDFTKIEDSIQVELKTKKKLEKFKTNGIENIGSFNKNLELSVVRGDKKLTIKTLSYDSSTNELKFLGSIKGSKDEAAESNVILELDGARYQGILKSRGTASLSLELFKNIETEFEVVFQVPFLTENEKTIGLYAFGEAINIELFRGKDVAFKARSLPNHISTSEIDTIKLASVLGLKDRKGIVHYNAMEIMPESSFSARSYFQQEQTIHLNKQYKEIRFKVGLSEHVPKGTLKEGTYGKTALRVYDGVYEPDSMNREEPPQPIQEVTVTDKLKEVVIDVSDKEAITLEAVAGAYILKDDFMSSADTQGIIIVDSELN